MRPVAARDHPPTGSERPVSHGSAHRQVYALCLLAAATALAISGTTAYSAYVDPVSPHTSTLIAQYARFLSVTLAAVWLAAYLSWQGTPATTKLLVSEHYRR